MLPALSSLTCCRNYGQWVTQSSLLELTGHKACCFAADVCKLQRALLPKGMTCLHALHWLL